VGLRLGEHRWIKCGFLTWQTLCEFSHHSRLSATFYDVSHTTILQLPCACDPPHTPSTDAGLSTDAGMQPDSFENRLLQLCAVWHSIWRHPEAPAIPEQHGAYISAFRRQLAASDNALAAC